MNLHVRVYVRIGKNRCFGSAPPGWFRTERASGGGPLAHPGEVLQSPEILSITHVVVLMMLLLCQMSAGTCPHEETSKRGPDHLGTCSGGARAASESSGGLGSGG